MMMRRTITQCFCHKKSRRVSTAVLTNYSSVSDHFPSFRDGQPDVSTVYSSSSNSKFSKDTTIPPSPVEIESHPTAVNLSHLHSVLSNRNATESIIQTSIESFLLINNNVDVIATELVNLSKAVIALYNASSVFHSKLNHFIAFNIIDLINKPNTSVSPLIKKELTNFFPKMRMSFNNKLCHDVLYSLLTREVSEPRNKIHINRVSLSCISQILQYYSEEAVPLTLNLSCERIIEKNTESKNTTLSTLVEEYPNEVIDFISKGDVHTKSGSHTLFSLANLRQEIFDLLLNNVDTMAFFRLCRLWLFSSNALETTLSKRTGETSCSSAALYLYTYLSKYIKKRIQKDHLSILTNNIESVCLIGELACITFDEGIIESFISIFGELRGNDGLLDDIPDVYNYYNFIKYIKNMNGKVADQSAINDLSLLSVSDARSLFLSEPSHQYCSESVVPRIICSLYPNQLDELFKNLTSGQIGLISRNIRKSTLSQRISNKNASSSKHAVLSNDSSLYMLNRPYDAHKNFDYFESNVMKAVKKHRIFVPAKENGYIRNLFSFPVFSQPAIIHKKK